MKKILYTLLAIALVATALLLRPAPVHAAFNANNLMDDGVFDNTGTMDAAGIDTFINQYANSCIASQKGFTAPDPSGYSPSGGFTYAGSVTAGKVIYDAAQAYGINPQVLLVTLQKEQSLVTGDAGCSVLRYTGAVGYGCPDGGTTYDYSGVNLYSINGVQVSSVSGTCVNSASKAGFSQQLIRAAWLLKFGEQRSEGNTSWAVIKPGWDNSDDPQTCYSGPMTQGTFKRCSTDANPVFYDGYLTIDGSSTHMDTGATAAFYWYTPHFAGNQNFDTLFQQWFGALYTPSYSWQWAGQHAYTDASKLTPKSLSGMLPGDRVYVDFMAKNTGNQTWTNTGAHPIRVGTVGPLERASAFYDNSWIGPSRPAVMTESSVAPGAIGTFSFWLTVPNTPGVYNERFGLLAEGLTWFNDTGLSYGITVTPRIFSWAWVSQYAYTDSTNHIAKSLNGLFPGDRVYVGFTARNTGNQTWTNSGPNPIRVGTVAPLERASAFYDSSWIGPSRTAVMKEASVPPGSVGTFEFWITVPNNTGTYNERFGLVSEGRAWFSDPGLSYGITVVPKIFSWQWASQYAYTDSTSHIAKNLNTLSPGSRVYIGFTAKNTGNQTWTNTGAHPIRVGTVAPLERTSAFYDSSWIGPTRPVVMKEASVAPGGIGTFEFWITAPSTPGTYNERFGLLSEGLAWFNDTGLSYGIKVQ